MTSGRKKNFCRCTRVVRILRSSSCNWGRYCCLRDSPWFLPAFCLFLVSVPTLPRRSNPTKNKCVFDRGVHAVELVFLFLDDGLCFDGWAGRPCGWAIVGCRVPSLPSAAFSGRPAERRASRAWPVLPCTVPSCTPCWPFILRSSTSTKKCVFVRRLLRGSKVPLDGPAQRRSIEAVMQSQRMRRPRRTLGDQQAPALLSG